MFFNLFSILEKVDIPCKNIYFRSKDSTAVSQNFQKIPGKNIGVKIEVEKRGKR